MFFVFILRINNLFPSFSSFNSENYKLSIMEIKKLALATVTTIYTEKQFAKFILENPDKDSSPYIQVVDNLKRGEKCAFEINGILPPRSIAVLPNEKEVEIGISCEKSSLLIFDLTIIKKKRFAEQMK